MTDIIFGGVTILAVGDLYQPTPCMYVSSLCSVLSDSYAKLYRSSLLWVDEIELDEFCELLC